jgi:hypothetical protein
MMSSNNANDPLYSSFLKACRLAISWLRSDSNSLRNFSNPAVLASSLVTFY